MTRAPALQVVTTDDLPEYPISRDVRIDVHYFVKWQHNRWLGSSMCIGASYEAKGMARDLFDMAQNQSPIGTLPDDDVLLSRMLHVDLLHWQNLRKQQFGPMHGWTRCLADGEVRLMHRVVLEQVQDALFRREIRELSKEEGAERKRLQRLRDGLVKLGCAPAVVDDGILMGRIDGWLTANWKTKRGQMAYAAAFVEAQQQG